jgi:hypothetical protein
MGIMARWGFWDWVAYGCLFIAAAVLAADQGLKGAPNVAAHLPSILSADILAFAPLGLVLIGSAILVIKDFGWLRTRTPPKPDQPISFGIRTSYVETSDRSLVGKSIIRCDVWAQNNTEAYLDGCQFNVVATNFELDTKEEKFAGSLPQRATARLHICDIMVANLSGEFLYCRSDEIGDFKEVSNETLVITIDVQFLSKDIGILKKELLIRGLMAAHEHIVIVDDKKEIENIMDSMRPDDDV